MLRIVATILVTLAVSVATALVQLRINASMYPEDVSDRWYGLEVAGIFGAAIYAWLYAVAVAIATAQVFPISGWRRIIGATVLLALPPLLVDGVGTYLLFDRSLEKTIEYEATVMASPFMTSIVIALMCMASNTSLERTRER